MEVQEIILGELDMEFGKRLKQARELAGLNQTELAKTIGTTKAQISQVENGSIKMIGGDKLFKVARALQVNPEWLVTGRGEQHGGFYAFPASDEAQALALRMDRLTKEKMRALANMIKQME